MRIFLLFNNLLLTLAVLLSSGDPAKRVAASPAAKEPVARTAAASAEMKVTLKAATGSSINFQAESKEEVPSPEPEAQEIPHLVLNRNGVPTPGFERTLIVSLENVVVPPGGAYAELTIESQHGDPDLEGGIENSIQVWEETRFLPYYGSETEQLKSVKFRIVFQRLMKQLGKTIRTPTDYFRYRVRLLDTQGNQLNVMSAPHAFLMENQWRVPLPQVLEVTPGAAPNELVVYFYDMLPFQLDQRDPYSQLSRSEVERYIQTELVPAMSQAFEMQTNQWGLPWYPEWKNHRTDEDPKTLSVALAERGTWYHGSAPSLGHAMISIRVDGSFGEYANLTDGILGVFHHELFHNQQRNISLHFGSKGNLNGKDQVWEVFSEGTAVLASLVAQPEVQFQPMKRDRSYLKRANAFLGAEGVFGGGLNKSYAQVPYHTAIYWRFLYEQCGGIKAGQEDPAAGMLVIRNILETLYKGEIANINTSAKISEALPLIITSALQATPDCPFQTHEDSLVHFARAIYQLRLEDGRCSVSVPSSDCGFYDPNHLYSSPHAEAYQAAAGATQINGSIPSSYGIDLLELKLDPSLAGKSIKLILRATSTPQDAFHVELRGLQGNPDELVTQPTFTQAKILSIARTNNSQLTLHVSGFDTTELEAIGVIVTRLDPHEDTGSPGNYVLQWIVE